MGLRLRHERIRRGWSQAYVGKQVGIAQTAIAMMESGQRKPSYEVLAKLEDLFDMGHRELFAEEADAEHDDHPK